MKEIRESFLLHYSLKNKIISFKKKEVLDEVSKVGRSPVLVREGWKMEQKNVSLLNFILEIESSHL